MAKDLLLIIDMQNIYTKGADWACLDTEGAADRLNQIISAYEAMESENAVLFTRYLAATDPVGRWKDYNVQYADINANDWGNEMLPQFASALEKYPLYTKSVYSSLAIPEVLAACKKADRVVVGGVVAECCVIATVWALIDAGIPVVYLTDGVSGFDQAKEDATTLTLSGLCPLHAEMMTVSEYLEALHG